MRLAVFLLLMAGLASGCGQRGALYLRDSPPPGVKPEKSAAERPASAAPAVRGDEDEKKR
jgi:predicted small lipoprotein YifL